MNPIKFQACALRRICLAASSDLCRIHLCALRFRPDDVVATDGTMLVRVPLPHDPARNFMLPSIAVARLLRKRGHRIVTVTRRDGETRIDVENAFDGDVFVVVDHPEISVDCYPTIEAVIDYTTEVGTVGDIGLSAGMWARIGKLARDLYPSASLDDSDDIDGRLPDEAPVSVIKAGSLTKRTPAHIACRSHHGDALIVAMPVRT